MGRGAGLKNEEKFDSFKTLFYINNIYRVSRTIPKLVTKTMSPYCVNETIILAVVSSKLMAYGHRVRKAIRSE